MASMKRGRDFGTSFEQQMKAFKPVKANPFTKMMEAARSAQLEVDVTAFPQASTSTAQSVGHQKASAAPSLAEPCTCCTHCGCGLTELQVQQCHACKNVYCSSCSVVNYDAREDRVFCLDCHPHHVTTCSDHDDFNVYEQYNDMAYDRPSGSGRDTQGHSNSRSNLMRACSRAAQTAAACSTPFSCFGAVAQANCGVFSGSGFGYSETPHQPAAGWSGGSVTGAVMPGSRAVGGSWNGLGSAVGAVRGSSRGFGISRENVLAGWDVSSPPALGSAGAGQLLATSPVIPFVANEGYCLASRAMEAAVTGC